MRPAQRKRWAVELNRLSYTKKQLDTTIRGWRALFQCFVDFSFQWRTSRALGIKIKEEICRLDSINDVMYLTEVLPDELVVMILKKAMYLNSTGHLLDKVCLRFQRLIKDYGMSRSKMETILPQTSEKHSTCFGAPLAHQCWSVDYGTQRRNNNGSAHCSMCAKLTFKRCSGCREHFYCSQGCQKQHWKLSHSSECTRQFIVS